MYQRKNKNSRITWANYSQAIISTLLVLFVLIGLLLFYSKHFIKYIAMPLDALQQKITDPSYKPQLDIKEAYKDDEVYEIFKILDKKDNSVGGY